MVPNTDIVVSAEEGYIVQKAIQTALGTLNADGTYTIRFTATGQTIEATVQQMQYYVYLTASSKGVNMFVRKGYKDGAVDNLRWLTKSELQELGITVGDIEMKNTANPTNQVDHLDVLNFQGDYMTTQPAGPNNVAVDLWNQNAGFVKVWSKKDASGNYILNTDNANPTDNEGFAFSVTIKGTALPNASIATEWPLPGGGGR